jgi:hypothetical protein
MTMREARAYHGTKSFSTYSRLEAFEYLDGFYGYD